jgi:transcription antitermination protein NusB
MADPHDPADTERTRTKAKRARHRGRPKRDDTDDPRRSRERALKVLFQADLRGVSPEDVLREVANDADARAMLDDLDELAPTEAEAVGEVAGASAASGVSGSAAGASGSSGSAAGAAGSSAGEDGGALGASVDETEAQRIWREERDRAAGRGSDESVAEVPAAVEEADHGVPPVDGFTRALVLGVHDHAGEIDELISRYARRWSISRMPVVDRTVLRLATYELLHEPTGAAVVINEAVELAKSLSTDDSGRYVNGVLESIRKEIAGQRTESPQDA